MVELGGGQVKDFGSIQSTSDLLNSAREFTHIFADSARIDPVRTLLENDVTCLKPTFIADKILQVSLRLKCNLMLLDHIHFR